MSRTKSSRRWLNEHFNDEYVKTAQAKGFRSRAVFKLIEIQEKDRIIKPGMNIIDLGAAPGSWSQYAADLVGKQGKIIALDILPIEAIRDNVEVIQGDFRELEVLDDLKAIINSNKVDIIFSDMAPNISGLKAIDQPHAMYLAELAFDMCQHFLKKGGVLLIKVFQGEGTENLISNIRPQFTKVIIRKPKASRQRSKEFYLLAKGFK